MSRIYFVHDHQEKPNVRRALLERAGFEVELFVHGDACLAAIARVKPALVLLDVLIEGRNGFEVARKIRTRFDAAELPILLGSHIYRSENYRNEAFLVGAQGYLDLPIEPEDLLQQVTDALEKSVGANDAA